jgi:hypothetical protein
MYDDYKQHFELLENSEDVKQLLFAIFDYHKNMTINPLSPMAKMAFSFIKSNLDRDMQKYEAIVNRNRNNGLKGGRPTKQPKKPSGLIGNPKNPSEPKKADTVTDTVNGTDTDTVNDTIKKTFKKYSEKDFINEVNSFTDYDNSVLSDFIDYWTEKTASGIMKFQTNKTWETSRRIKKWVKNSFNSPKPMTKRTNFMSEDNYCPTTVWPPEGA